MTKANLDDTDRQILALLHENARRTVADIAERVNLSPAPVKRRIDHLEASGVIKGYTVVVDHERLGDRVEAFTELRFMGNASVEDIAATVQGMPEVRALFTTAGDPDALVWMSIEDLADLKRVVDRLRRSGRVTGTKTMMVIDTWTPPHGALDL